jgi:hypothetical protein
MSGAPGVEAEDDQMTYHVDRQRASPGEVNAGTSREVA